VSPEFTVNSRSPVAAPPGAVPVDLILAAVLLADPVLSLPPENNISWFPEDHVLFSFKLAPEVFVTVKELPSKVKLASEFIALELTEVNILLLAGLV
jgi:hypothetical protein